MKPFVEGKKFVAYRLQTSPVGITRDTAARSRLAESCVEEPSDRERETRRPILLAAQVATIQGGAAPREVCSRSAPNFGLHRERFAAGLHQIFFGYATYYSFPGTCAVRYSQAECHHHLASWEREPEDYIVAAAAGAAGAAC